MKTCQIPQESVGLTGRGKLLSTTTKGEKHKTKMTKNIKQMLRKTQNNRTKSRISVMSIETAG
jgi:hypothetical protein